MNARCSLMNQESKGSLGATIMINYVSIREDRVSICILLPPRHMTRLHHVVSRDGFRLLSVLVFCAGGPKSADTGLMTHLTGLMPLRGGRGPFSQMDAVFSIPSFSRLLFSQSAPF